MDGLELALVALMTVAALGWLVLRSPHGRSIAVCVALGAAGVGTAAAVLRRPTVDETLRAELPIPGFGKVYASSTACRACHPGEYESWHKTFHRTMTQPATPAAVVGDFAGITLTSWGRDYRLERRG